ncbi:hypothetical protein EU527_15005 [Candidatus Thorarchaeota archaeon]|nr:MAG: hypothetical protein EU527_15005 [Candidatus Thorarchaeota archaeon]
MKQIRCKKGILLLLIVMTTILTAGSFSIDFKVKGYNMEEHKYPAALVYEDHAPISIDGNSDFLNQASIEGWSGNGSINNPITITGYRIAATGMECIKLSNIDCHWVISDCLIEGGAPYSYGMHFINATNGVVSNNIIRDRDIAIQISLKSCNCVFTGNQIYDNVHNAIKVLNGMANCVISGNYMNNNSANNIWIAGGFNSSNIIDNVIIGGDNGIRVNIPIDCIIRNNTISESQLDSIVVPVASNTSICENTVINPTGMGIMSSGHFLVIESNTVDNSTTNGLYLSSGNNCTIKNNRAMNCIDYALVLGASTADATVSENVFIDNNEGGCQVKDDGDENVFCYNHYNDWIAPDEDSDNIVDEPYSIDGNAENTDPYPLVDPDVGIPVTTMSSITTTTTASSGTLNLILYTAIGAMVVLVTIAAILIKRK